MAPILLPEPDLGQTAKIVAAGRRGVVLRHGVEVGRDAVASCIRAAQLLEGHMPAKALALLEAAAAGAALAGGGAVTPEHVHRAAARFLTSE